MTALRLLCLAAFLALASAPTGARGLADLYTDDVLRHWQGRYPQNIEWNFQNLVLGSLTPRERARVEGVTLAFPLRAEGELADQPLAFYAAGQTITVPILSVKFFDDIALAWAYLWANDYDLETVTDYLGMLKYQDPASLPGGRFPSPLEAMGIPADIWKQDKRVDDVSQKTLKSGLVWVLAHELGHIYHRHPGYGPGVTREQAQENEAEADRFATEIMRRIGVAPLGMAQLFMAMAHLSAGRGDFADDTAWQRYLRDEATHPLTAHRLRDMAEGLRAAAGDFSAERLDREAARETVLYVADQLAGIGEILEDPGIHRLFLARALATDLDSLKPRKSQREPATKSDRCASASAGAAPFQGRYAGLYAHNLADGRKEWLSGWMDLRRDGNRVRGRFSFGAGDGTLEGNVVGDRLLYDWAWGRDQGRGTLELQAADGGLTGNWGRGTSGENGGAWDLCPG